MIALHPFWLEPAIVAGIALLFGLPVWFWDRYQVQELKRALARPGFTDWFIPRLKRYICLEFYALALMAPLVEETIACGAPVIVWQTGRYWAALVLALILNVPFTFAHNPKYGIKIITHDNSKPPLPTYLKALYWGGINFIGYLCALVGLLSGLLSLAVLAHSLLNLTIGGAWKDLRKFQRMSQQIKNAPAGSEPKITGRLKIGGQTFNF